MIKFGLSKGFALPSYFRLLTGLFQTAWFARTAYGDLKLKLTPDLLTALRADQRVREDLQSSGWNHLVADSAQSCFHCHEDLLLCLPSEKLGVLIETVIPSIREIEQDVARRVDTPKVRSYGTTRRYLPAWRNAWVLFTQSVTEQRNDSRPFANVF